MNEQETWLLFALATRTLHRARGLLCMAPQDGVLLLLPCNDIHTIGMKHKIDVAFVDRMGCVVEVGRAIGPLHRLRNKSAVAVVERFAICGDWFETGDRIGVVRLREKGKENNNEKPIEVAKGRKL